MQQFIFQQKKSKTDFENSKFILHPLITYWGNNSRREKVPCGKISLSHKGILNMAADPGEISEDLSKDQLSTGLNFGRVHEKPMEISTGMEEGALESTEIVVKPTNGVLTDQVSTCPQEEVPLVSDLVPVELMEVDPLPSSETAVVPGTDENGLNQTDVQQKSLDGTASNSQDNLVSSELSEGKAPLTKSKEPPSSDVTCVEVSENATNVSMAEASGNVVYPIYVNSLQEAEEVLHRFENNTKTRFCVWRCPKDFGASSKCSAPNLFRGF